MHPSLQGKDKKERRHLEKLEKALKQATVKASPRTGATAPTKTEDGRPSTNMRLTRSIRDRKAHPQPSRLGISLGDSSNASPVVAVGTTTTVTHCRAVQPAGPAPIAAAPAPTTAAPAPTTAAPAPPPRPAQRIVVAVPPAPAPAAVTAARGPSTTTLRRPIRPDTTTVPPTRVLVEASEDTTTPCSGSTLAAAPETETPLTGEWMAERVTWSSEIQVQEGRIVHNAATPLRQALWASTMLDIAAQTGLLPATLLDEADRLFLAVEKCRGTRLRTLRSWHAPYKSKQPGVSAGARRVQHLPSAQPAVQAPAAQATQHPVQQVMQPIPPVTPAHTAVREPLTPLNALPRGGGEEDVEDEPVLPMLARKCALRAPRRMGGAHTVLSSTA